MFTLQPSIRDEASPHILRKPIYLILLILAFAGSASADNNYQKIAFVNHQLKPNNKISLSIKGESLSAVLEKIESISGYSFVYSNEEIDASRRIDFKITDADLGKTLDELLNPLRISHKIIKSKIILKAEKNNLAPVIEKTKRQATVTGKVVDEKNESLPGVTVVLKGTATGVVTDISGDYSIVVPDPNSAILVFSYIGYFPQEIAIVNRTSIEVKMVPNLESLGEVVVVGYATQKKVNLTGAVSMVNAEALESKPVTNVSQALQGTAPNLIIQQQSSEPGSQLNINIRGIGTIGDNSPLIVIDGIPSNSGALSSINPNDIESISVLKDAASASIFGSRSANGVILVTTKQGNFKTKPTVTYNGILGWQTPTFRQQTTSAYEYAMLKNEALVNSDQSPQFSPEDLRRIHNQPENSWYLDEIIKKSALQQTHNVGINGGTEAVSYLISVGHMRQNSNFVGSNFGYNRTNARANVTTKINNKLRTGLMVAYTKNTIKEHAYGTDFIVADAARIPRLYPIKDTLGRYVVPPTSTSNPLARLEKGGTRSYDNDNFYGNLFGEYNVFKDLKLKAVFGANLWDYQQHEFRKSIDYLPYIGGDGENSVTDENIKTLQTNLQIIADYKITINLHSFTLLGGYSSEGYDENRTRLRMVNVDNEIGIPDDPKDIDLKSTYKQRGTPWALNSYFGRINYNYVERYLLEGNLRYDGSSRFAKDRRWGLFPSVSAGWRITEEPFFIIVKEKVGNVKLRGSWGRLGNQNIGSFRYMSMINNSPNTYGFNNKGVSGAYFRTPNPFITWETSTMLDIGADIDVLNSKLSVSFDYFKKRTEDILLDLPVPLTFGADAPLVNAAVVDNKGWEVAITYVHKGSSINHRISANLSDNLNTVIDVKGKENIEGGDRSIILKEGFPISSYYGYRSDGLFQNAEEIEAGPAPGFVANGKVFPGDIRYLDKDGDGTITPEKDRFVLGNPFPRYSFGFNYSTQWRGFDLNLFIQGVGKRNLYLRGEAVEAFHNNWENVYKQHLDRWTPTNTDATYPRLTVGTASTNNNAGSNYWLQNAAYARLKNIQLGYTIPATASKTIGVSKARLYLTGQNLFTITKMTNGYDPEISEFNNSLRTTDGKVNSGRVYPNLKVYALGVDISF